MGWAGCKLAEFSATLPAVHGLVAVAKVRDVARAQAVTGVFPLSVRHRACPLEGGTFPARKDDRLPRMVLSASPLGNPGVVCGAPVDHVRGTSSYPLVPQQPGGVRFSFVWPGTRG